MQIPGPSRPKIEDEETSILRFTVSHSHTIPYGIVHIMYIAFTYLICVSF